MRDWIIETLNTVAFFVLMALVYVLLAMIFPDPSYW